MTNKRNQELIEFFKEYGASTIIVCGIVLASLVVTALLGLAFFGLLYKISYSITPENYQWIFFSVFWYSKDLSVFVYDKINAEIIRYKNPV